MVKFTEYPLHDDTHKPRKGSSPSGGIQNFTESSKCVCCCNLPRLTLQIRHALCCVAIYQEGMEGLNIGSLSQGHVHSSSFVPADFTLEMVCNFSPDDIRCRSQQDYDGSCRGCQPWDLHCWHLLQHTPVRLNSSPHSSPSAQYCKLYTLMCTL